MICRFATEQRKRRTSRTSSSSRAVDRRRTSSYSRINGTETLISKEPLPIADTNRKAGPLRERKADTITLVSKTARGRAMIPQIVSRRGFFSLGLIKPQHAVVEAVRDVEVAQGIHGETHGPQEIRGRGCRDPLDSEDPHPGSREVGVAEDPSGYAAGQRLGELQHPVTLRVSHIELAFRSDRETGRADRTSLEGVEAPRPRAVVRRVEAVVLSQEPVRHRVGG